MTFREQSMEWLSGGRDISMNQAILSNRNFILHYIFSYFRWPAAILSKVKSGWCGEELSPYRNSHPYAHLVYATLRQMVSIPLSVKGNGYRTPRLTKADRGVLSYLWTLCHREDRLKINVVFQFLLSTLNNLSCITQSFNTECIVAAIWR